MKKSSRKPAMENLETRNLMATLPYGAMPDDTGEFFLGKVAVTPVLLESDGTIDTSSENWNTGHINQVLANLNSGLDWWTDLLATKSAIHTLDFEVDNTYATTPVKTAYEPINRVSNDYVIWVSEFLNRVGFNQTTSLDDNMRAFNNAQRAKLNADWSFTVFVVNSQAEQDGTFATGGTFTRAFAFAGGLFFVVPSTRPASTYAHETGHMFWARDEYQGGGTFLQRRGYYNTQNLNAIDLNQPGFQQATSIMSAGVVLQNAYDQVVSPPSTLAMVGWQDSDNDGIFDVLDVPMSLNGVGWTESGVYKFKGTAKTKTLGNINSSGLQNDITLNKISRIEYRLNGGTWTTFSTPNAYEVDLDLSIPVGSTTGTIEIRAIDAATQITSNILQGTLQTKADATATTGITGFVWNDIDSDGNWDNGEGRREGFTVQLVDSNGQLLALQKQVEPDQFGTGEIPSGLYEGVTLSAVGLDTDGSVGIFVDNRASTGTRVFRPYSTTSQDFISAWQGNRQQLRIDFQNPTNFVSVDVIGASSESYGRLELYNSAGELLQRTTTDRMTGGQVVNLALGRATRDIAYAIVKGHLSTGVAIDNLKYGPTNAAKTDAYGRYQFEFIPNGTYQIQVIAPTPGHVPTAPGTGRQSVTVLANQATTHVDFGIHYTGSPWNNDLKPVDVNNDKSVTPLDALLIINQLNRTGSIPLDGSSVTTPPFLDVTNDRNLTPLDALLVINYLNQHGIGEGEVTGSSSGGGSGGSSGGSGGGYGGAGEPGGELVIEPRYDRYAAEVGPLLADKKFVERLEMPRWTEPIPCNCPYCASIG